MRIVRSVAALQSYADGERAAGKRIALVPTMGALHAGHLSLVAEACGKANRVVLSIFVNPAQFGPGEDLASYPRSLESDLAACRDAGVDVVFTPDAEEMYPEGHQTFVEVTGVTGPLCGRDRPTHFRGVTTVVSKLLLAAKPHVAVFGEKDFQQLVAIRRMVRDLHFDVEIVGGPIVREPDGLALSSRNAYLDAESRREALALVRALDAAERAVAGGERESEAVLSCAAAELAKAPRARVDYVELRDAETLEPAPPGLRGPTLLALAVRFPRQGSEHEPRWVRLIDNRLLHPSSRPGKSARSIPARREREFEGGEEKP
jgi:pantoate--beta-alanine ligase